MASPLLGYPAIHRGVWTDSRNLRFRGRQDGTAVSQAAAATALAACLLIAGAAGCSSGARGEVSFSLSGPNIDAYDFAEVTATVSGPAASHPFIDATLTGSFETADGTKRWQVEGFCDADDGSVFRIRFMPPKAGDYRYSVEYSQGGFRRSSEGVFHASDGHRRGPIRVDPQYPWHFIWEGTGEHYFFNGTTAYWLLGWRDDAVIDASIERLHQLKINRMRVTIAGRTNQFYGEPVMAGGEWTPFVVAWPAENPDDLLHPGFDYTRMNLPYWRKFERALRFARERDMIVSLVLDMGDSQVHPYPGGEDEHRFIRYAVDRFGAFSNITWDLGDDLDRYRNDAWTHTTGSTLEAWDPYDHLATSHPIDNVHQDRTSAWFDFTSFQEWSRNQHAFMLNERSQQVQLGRIIPQTNEEYGYEDHYPLWAPEPPGDSADVLRRTAWDIVMAGGYQTSGETARRGTGVWPDTGGGWMNGRGDDTMTMFAGYGHMVDFFTGFEWWKAEPHDELVSRGDYCLADPGNTYAVYLPHGGSTTVRLPPGRYEGTRFNPRTGESTALPSIDGGAWTSPVSPDEEDWALLIQRQREQRP